LITDETLKGKKQNIVSAQKFMSGQF